MGRAKVINPFRNYSTVNDINKIICKDEEIDEIITVLDNLKEGKGDIRIVTGDEKSGKTSMLSIISILGNGNKDIKRKFIKSKLKKASNYSYYYKFNYINCKKISDMNQLKGEIIKEAPIALNEIKGEFTHGINKYGVGIGIKHRDKSLKDIIIPNNSIIPDKLRKKRIFLFDDCGEMLRSNDVNIHFFRFIENYIFNSPNRVTLILTMSDNEYKYIRSKLDIRKIEIKPLNESEKEKFDSSLFELMENNDIIIELENIKDISKKFNYEIYDIIQFWEYVIDEGKGNNITQGFIVKMYKNFVINQYESRINKYNKLLDDNQKNLFNKIMDINEEIEVRNLLDELTNSSMQELNYNLDRMKKLCLIHKMNEKTKIRSKFIKDCFEYNKKGEIE